MRKRRNETFDKLLREIPLRIRVKTTIQAFFLDRYNGHFFMPCDETGEPHAAAVKKNEKILTIAQSLIDDVLKEIDDWEKEHNKE